MKKLTNQEKATVLDALNIAIASLRQQAADLPKDENMKEWEIDLLRQAKEIERVYWLF